MKFDPIRAVKDEASRTACYQCHSVDFHRSHPRRSDFTELVRGRLPVRCAHCRKRQFVPLYVFMKLK
jgi:hypothetical protein